MHKIMKLKERILEELAEYAEKKSFTMEDVTTIKALSSAADHLCNVVADAEEGEYSERSYRGSYRDSYDDGMNSRRGYDDGMSNARGRRNARRDSMGRYSGDGYSRAEDMAVKFRDLMREAPDDDTRNELHRLADRFATM
jgi:hypothetical protein